MSKPSSSQITVLAVGMACVVLLIAWWPRGVSEAARSPTRREPSAKSTPRAASSAVAEPGALSPAVRALLDDLQRALATLEARRREAVLSFKDDAALARFLERAATSGLTVVARADKLRSVRVRWDSFDSLQNELLANGDDYSAAGANNLFTIPIPPAREDRALQNQVPFGNDTLRFLGATGDRTAWGRGEMIAILDTGVSADATFGTGRITPLDIGLGITPGKNNAQEGGHGTAVAALAAGASPDAPGVSPAANILSIRVTDQNGTSDIFTLSQAIVAAVDAGAKIINISLGGYSTGAVLDAALGYATQQGALIVAAAGNDQAAQLTWPAADPRVISVGAVDKAEQQVAFSNSGAQLQLTAPGYGVQTAWLDGQRVYVDGTSASAPIVAGAIAALMSKNPSLTPQLAAELLTRTASDAGAPGADPAFGRGILNLGTAMNSGNPSYVDTAVASHYYDAEHNQMQLVVQNRSGRTVSGMSLNIGVGTTATTQTVPSLAAGETYIATVPVNDIALKQSGSLPITTQLTNPMGMTDQVPANNQRSSVLTAPKK